MKLAKNYEPNQYEPNTYALWEQSGAFKPKGSGEPYSIVMPPPNANGNLHVGHALTVALEDIQARYHRMKGRDVAYLPGADHAGFETWVVYERLLNEKGQSRFDFSREQLYSQVWDFVEQQRGNMEVQLRALGASASWDNLTFTLDSKVIKTAYSTFKNLWDEGLIYRGERIVNYSTKYQTSYSDIEVNHKVEKGTLWRIAYPSLDKIKEIVVATTRPETMLGDVAVAVHPDDKRYKDMIGTKVLLPLVNKEIPVIADDSIDMNFGTGAVKITPAHDPNDFEMGKRHNLLPIQVIGFDGKMTNCPPQFAGLEVEEARKQVLAALDAQELRRGEEEIEHSVGYDYKSGLPIQPMIKDQWFIKMTPLAQKAIEAIEQGTITFYPNTRKRALLNYLKNVKDWNISRQIPWGIPIPAFQNQADPEEWIFDERVELETITVDGKVYHREEDTFDTWFSSGQWPFITTDALDAAAGGDELSRFYPTSLMETGFDLLYQWVGRMIMLGLHITGEVPFKDVYLHGMVLDERGQKMSKSKGNVINPMEMINEYGSDALRLGIIASRSAGQSQAFSREKVMTGRNFANKLWNIARFIEAGREAPAPATDALPPQPPSGAAHAAGVGAGAGNPDPTALSLADHWVIRELNAAAEAIGQALETYRFAEASEMLYHVVWDSVADWYIEASKVEPNPGMLTWVLESILKLSHPFAPFVSETIWQTLESTEGLLITSEWYAPRDFHELSAQEFDQLRALVSEARFVARELPGGKQTLTHGHDSLIADNARLITKLAGLKEVVATDTPSGLRLAVPNREAYLQVDEKTLEDHQGKLEVRLAEVHAHIKVLEGRLANENYMQKAPAHLVEETRENLTIQKELATRLQRELDVI